MCFFLTAPPPPNMWIMLCVHDWWRNWLTYEIYSGDGPSTYVYCMVSYRVIAAPYVRSVVNSLHTITLLMVIRNAQWTMSSLYSLMFELCPVLHYCPRSVFVSSIDTYLYSNYTLFAIEDVTGQYRSCSVHIVHSKYDPQLMYSHLRMYLVNINHD